MRSLVVVFLYFFCFAAFLTQDSSNFDLQQGSKEPYLNNPN